MAAIVDGGKLRLSGTVGDYWFEDGFTSADVIMALAELDETSDLDVFLNSGGGVATEGEAIRAIFAARTGKTHIIIEGIAASAASLIAMAGDTISMSAGAVMMIHKPAAYASGTDEDLEKARAMLATLSTAYARVYAARSGKTADECLTLMAAETWFTADEAIAAGFADAEISAAGVPVAAFDYRVFEHAPKRLVAMAKAKGWALPPEKKPTASGTAPEPSKPKEPTMTDKTASGADAAAAELDRLRAEHATLLAEKNDRERRDAVMALPEAKGREKLAGELANAGLGADQAKAALLAAPLAAPEDDDPADVYDRARATAAGMQEPAPRKPRATIDRRSIFAMRAGNQGA
ncbi:head maturation protease, ClpP-related [Paracoccus sp. (in: a-proteobacteria)]|uniref:head maturation protease, ClpP-related n=1 Tax=Paracoccus sp. TaxID=267 RepID=UPI002B003827|nr:head maturation protease, ClpP-related [Paracoccus sp. (in: a-proteobacteria)]